MRSHRNNRARTTARERAHNWAASAGWCDEYPGHTQDCDQVTKLLSAHAREALARKKRRS